MPMPWRHRQRGWHWLSYSFWLGLVGCVVLCGGCRSEGESGQAIPPPALNSRLEQQAITNVLALYRTAMLQEDIDRLQELLPAEGRAAQEARRAMQRVPQQGAPDTFMDAVAFRQAVEGIFRTLAITSLSIPEDTVQIAPNRRSVAFLEMMSVEDPVTLEQRTYATRTTFQLTRVAMGETIIFRIAAVRQEPLAHITTFGQIVADTLTRILVTEVPEMLPLHRVAVVVPETEISQELAGGEERFHGTFRAPAHPHPQPLHIHIEGTTGEEMVLLHHYRLRTPGDGVVEPIRTISAGRFFAVALAPDGTVWFGGQTRRPAAVGTIVQVAADGQTLLRTVAPSNAQLPPETTARIEDIVVDRRGRLHFLFVAQTVAQEVAAPGNVVGNGDLVLDVAHGDIFCQTVNVLDADYPFRVRDLRTGTMFPSPSTRLVAAEDGAVWLLGSDGGVGRAMDTFDGEHCTPERVEVTYRLDFRREPQGLLSNTAPALIVGSEGPRWFGTALGVTRLEAGRFTPVLFNPGLTLQGDSDTKEGFFRELAEAIFQARPVIALAIGQVSFVDAFGRGVAKEDLVFSAVEDPPGRLWAGTLGGGLRRIETRDGRLQDTLHLTRQDGLSGNIIFALASGPDHTVWAATDEGVSRIQNRNGMVNLTTFSPLDAVAAPVRDIAVDAHGIAWVATDGGLFRIMPRGNLVRGVVRDPAGRPVAGADIVVLGTPFRAVTDTDGSFTLWNLPRGPQWLQFDGRFAVDGPFLSAFHDIIVTAREQTLDVVVLEQAEPRGLDLVRRSEEQQAALVGTRLPMPLVVAVEGPERMPVPGIPVTFQVVKGSGALSPETALTAADGRAGTIFTVGPTPGLSRVQASVSGVEPVVFTVLGITPDMVRLLPVAGNNQVVAPGEALPAPLVARLEDQFGNPFAGALVTATITGDAVFLSPATVTTDEQGEARFFLRAGTEEGSPVRIQVTALEQTAEFVILVGFVRPVDVAVTADGALVVVDTGLGVLRVDPVTGDQRLVSAFDARGQGPAFLAPTAIAVAADGALIVLNSFLFGAVLRVDPVTGERTVLSGCRAVGLAPPAGEPRCVGGFMGRGPRLRNPRDVVVDEAGALVLIDDDRVIRIHPTTGDRQLVSGLDPDTAQTRGRGLPLRLLEGVAVQANGAVVVVSFALQAVIRVDPVSGDRQLVSACRRIDEAGRCTEVLRGQGPALGSVRGIAVEPDGSLVTINDRSVVRVHPVTGDRLLVSGSDPETGTTVGGGRPFDFLVSVTIEADGALVVVDVPLISSATRLTRVHPVTGDRRVVAGPRLQGSGGALVLPMAIAVTAQQSLVVADVERVVQVDPVTGDRRLVSGCLEVRPDPDSGLLGCVGEPVGEGPRLAVLRGMAMDVHGALIVVNDQAIVHVDPASGRRTVVSGCLAISPAGTCMGELRGQGPRFGSLEGVAITANDTLVVVDSTRQAVLSVNPHSGERKTVSGCPEVTAGECLEEHIGSGTPFVSPRGIAVDANGFWIVVDAGLRAVLRVDPTSGARETVSGCSAVDVLGMCSGEVVGRGPHFGVLEGLTVETGGALAVVSLDAVLRVEPGSGRRTIVSGCSAVDVVGTCRGERIGRGPFFLSAVAIAREDSRTFVVVDNRLGAVLRVDANTGDRVILSR